MAAFDLLGLAVLGAGLVAASATDIRHMRIPDRVTLPLLAAGLFWAWAGGTFWAALTGAVLGGSVFWAVAAAYRRLRGRTGLGLGDAKLMAAGGAWVGWQGLAAVAAIAAGAGLAWILLAALISGERDRLQRPVPFGPFLALGIFLRALAG